MIKIYGLHRSGTNLIISLLRRNFNTTLLINGYDDDTPDNLCKLDYHCLTSHVDGLNNKETFPSGWKHGPPPICKETTTCPVDHILCVKNPLAWLSSLWEWQKKEHTSFQQFLRQPSAHFVNPVVRWDMMNRMWILLPNCMIIRHEDMLTPQQQIITLQKLCEQFDVRCKLPFLQSEDEEISMDQMRIGKWDPQYYKNKTYLDKFSESDLRFVRSYLQRDLVQHLGYDENIH